MRSPNQDRRTYCSDYEASSATVYGVADASGSSDGHAKKTAEKAAEERQCATPFDYVAKTRELKPRSGTCRMQLRCS